MHHYFRIIIGINCSKGVLSPILSNLATRKLLSQQCQTSVIQKYVLSFEAKKTSQVFYICLFEKVTIKLYTKMFTSLKPLTHTLQVLSLSFFSTFFFLSFLFQCFPHQNDYILFFGLRKSFFRFKRAFC